MRDDALAQGDEFRVAHVVLGVVGAPRADDEAQRAVRFKHVVAIGAGKRQLILIAL